MDLKSIMKDRGIKTLELAEITDLPVSSINKYCNGRIKPSLVNRRKLILWDERIRDVFPEKNTVSAFDSNRRDLFFEKLIEEDWGENTIPGYCFEHGLNIDQFCEKFLLSKKMIKKSMTDEWKVSLDTVEVCKELDIVHFPNCISINKKIRPDETYVRIKEIEDSEKQKNNERFKIKAKILTSNKGSIKNLDLRDSFYFQRFLNEKGYRYRKFKCPNTSGWRIDYSYRVIWTLKIGGKNNEQ